MMGIFAAVRFLVAVFALNVVELPLQSSANNLSVCGDDRMDLYLDGVRVNLPQRTTWNVADRVALLPGVRLVAIHGHNEWYAAGLVASDADGLVMTTGRWKYSTQLKQGWEKLGFNDAGWKTAYVRARNDGYTWSRVSLISRYAALLWSPGLDADQDVYFRYRIRYDFRVRNYIVIERDRQVVGVPNALYRLSRLQCSALCGQLVLSKCAGFQYSAPSRTCYLLDAPALIAGNRHAAKSFNIYSAINITEPCC